jgi:Tfp pilus assembly protein PilO
MNSGPNPKTFMILSAVTIFAGIGATYFGFTQKVAVEGEVSALKAEVKEESEVQAELDTAKATLEECATKLKHLEQGVPEFAYIPTLMTELERTGKQHGIKVLGVRPMIKVAAPVKKSETDGEATLTTKKAYEELTIEVKGNGDYGSIMRWVNSLQQFPKIVAARAVSLSPKAEPGRGMYLDVTVELRAYVFKQPETGVSNADLSQKTASLGVNRNEG